MKTFHFVKHRLVRTFSVFIICLMMLNSLPLYFFSSSTSDVDQNNYAQFINQEFNLTSESSCTKVNYKLLPESYSSNFYSYEYCLKKLSLYPKILTIISETNSEHNIRYSSFQLTQNTTST